jgi:hypothetical protein
MKTYFVFDNAKTFIDNAEKGIIPTHLLYGGYHLLKENKGEIIDFKQCGKIKNQQVIIINPQYALKLKRNHNKVILININSNHILERSKMWLKKWFVQKIYGSIDIIICLDKSQIKPLQKFGVKSELILNPLLIDTQLMNLAITRNKYSFVNHHPYYLSAGYDAGRNFTFFNDIDSSIPIVTIGRHNIMNYDRYCKFLAGCSGMVLNIVNGPASSDISGNTVVLDALCAQKPVFINDQPWLKHIKTKNIYLYNDSKHLENLLNSNIKWIPEKEVFAFDKYYKKLKQILKVK